MPMESSVPDPAPEGDPQASLVDARPANSHDLGAWRIANIIDRRALRVKLTSAAQDNFGNPAEMRKAALDHLHGAMFRGRMIAQERLQQGADGLDTARLLSAVQDEVIHALYDFTTTHVHRARNPTEAERLAVLATGGYGRGVMAPSSDTDLLFLRAYKVSPHTESVVEYMLYAMWDMGLKVGNAFRTPSDCTKLAADDVTIKTSLLDSRFLCGDEVLANDMKAMFDKDLISGRDAEFIADKLAERDARHARQGDARYVVEPNLKEGKGGLRDLQTLYWIVKHMYGGITLEDVMQNGPFTAHEYAVFIRAARFLWTVRCHLHYLTGRAEERLSFDLQPEIAARMGFRERADQQAVERFMKRYFLVTKDVGGLTRILAAKLEADNKKQPEGLRRFLPQRTPQALPDEGFVIDAGRVSIIDDSVMQDDPLNMLRLFTIAQREKKDIHPQALTELTRNLRQFNEDLRRTDGARQLMLDILLGDDQPGLALRRMNESGLLGRVIPEFGGIVAQTQFNMYHHYTVDEHTIRAVEAIANMEHGRDEGAPLIKDCFAQMENRRALYLAMLLHDTGKGKGDQQIVGMQTATQACERLGLPEAETELVAWLVGHHLVMSETAQKRDIADPRTVANFMQTVGTLEQLRLLYILTVADIKAVGPGVWNAWKGQLLADLYRNTAAALRGGRSDEAGIQRELEARAEDRRAALIERRGTMPPLMLAMETAYWMSFEPDELDWHAECLSAPYPVVRHRVAPEGGALAVLLAGKDRTGLFADVTGTLARLGTNVISAHVFSTPAEEYLNVFMIQDNNKRAYGVSDPTRLERLEVALREALDGTMPEMDVKTKTSRREAAFVVLPSVQIQNDLSAEYTVIDVAGRDRPGLLYDVASVFAEFDLGVHSAHIGSYGERVFDAFYVRSEDGHKVHDDALKQTLRERLRKVLERDEPDAPQTPARTLKRSRAVDSF